MSEMSEIALAGFITPSKKEIREWKERKIKSGWIVYTFTNKNKGKREYWGIVIGRVESK